ncbi:hypothetical protein B1R32_10679 [Abditibacterium utsteinense]|uniref:Copper amine oxidase N-terminal domain-containing protein n=1 Tax=Abditibacterium utsteinense TaxID=1960156 RepID=A0A2S8STV3_9BACT|nr:hypothetical protein [Abditibacterium utsteinense]PQV64234.1 hypothetical protein B1R32_10679 [Abditibacterium utsteinense]
MRYLWMFLSLMVFVGPSRADLISATFGTPQLLRPAKARVQLESETTRVRVFEKYAEETATYQFRNLGGATTVAMSLCETEAQGSYRGPVPGFASFSARLDNQPLPTQQQSSQRTEAGIEPQNVVLHVAQVHFAPAQTRRIELKGRTTQYEGLLFDGDLSYVFGGSHWAEKVKKSEINVEFRVPNTYILNAYQGTRDYFEDTDAVPIETRGATATFNRRNWRPAGKFSLSFVTTLVPDWLAEKGVGILEKTLTVSGKAQGLAGVGFYLPPALVREGVTFVRLDLLSEKFRLPRREVELVFEKPFQVATLSAGRQKIRFQRGQKRWSLNGRTLTLPVAPFAEVESGHDIGEDTVLYVPLFPVVKALGGSANANQKTHRFYVRLPGSMLPLDAEEEK